MDRTKTNEIDIISKNIQKIKTNLEKLNRNYSSLSGNILDANKDLPKKEIELDNLKESKAKIEKEVNSIEN